MEELLRRLPILVGRSEEQRLISRTVTGAGPSTILIVGEAGIGKTRLLEEIEHLIEKPEVRRPDLLCLPILDFYNTAMHSEVAIEEAIVRNLTERGVDQAFQEFEDKLIEYREGRISEEHLWKSFKKGYDSVCQNKRIILRFDTAELLEYEHDDPEVLDDCDVRGLESPALGWLAEKTSQLLNTALIIASRPNANLRKRLDDAYDKNVQLVDLGGLTLEETREYFRQAGGFAQQVLKGSPEAVEKVWLLTDGRPIFISLSLDWLRRGIWDEKIDLIDVVELRKICEQGGKEWEELKRSFTVALIRRFREQNAALDKAIYYTARARKGYNAELLAQIMEISEQEARRLANQLMEQSFVKQPHLLPSWRKEWFFLHDEIYDLMEKEVWNRFWPEYTEQERLAKEIIAHYDEEIQQVQQGIREAKTEIERRALRYQRQVLLTERLYYQFDFNPRQGLAEYERLHLQACDEKEWEWDNALRVEALRFARQRPERAMYAGWVTTHNGKPKIADWVNMDCKARWVYRYVARNDFEKVVEIATKLLAKYPDADKLWQARLYVSKAVAEERLGRLGANWLFDEIEEDIHEAIKLLDETPLNTLNEWTAQYYRATAWVYEGLAASALGELGKASKANEEAILPFKAIDYQAGEARALNNQAYILARQGKRQEALKDCQEALQKRQEAGDERGIGLSFNTLGIVKYMGGDYPGALTESLSALRLFQRRRDEIGIAMARINLGRACRHYGSSDLRKNPKEIEKYFALAEDSLLQAREKENTLEPYYRVEAHNELGCAYKDWANFLALHRADRPRYYALMEKADYEFGLADGIAGTTLALEKADNLEDWAWVYHLRYAYRDQMEEKEPANLYRQASDKLNTAEDLLMDFTLRQDRGLEGHLNLGKIYFQRAHLLKFCEDWPEVAQNYALAAAYLETYSEEAEELKGLLLAVEGWLGTRTETEVSNLTTIMKTTLDAKDKEGWQCGRLLRWIDDVILAAPTLGSGG